MMTSTTSFPLPRSAPPAWPLKWKRSRELELPTQNNTHSAQKKERFYDEDFPLKKKNVSDFCGRMLFDDYIRLHGAK